MDESLKVKNIADCKLFFDFFIKFFINLGNLVGEDYSSTYRFNDQNYIPNLNQVNENKYLRLRVGPTFNELLHLANYYFEDKKIDIRKNKLHALISTTLDRQIDQGFIIQVFDCYGRRIFRKGDNTPYNIYEIQLLQSLGLKPSFSNVRKMVYSLNHNKQEEIFDALNLYDIYGDDDE